MSRLSHPKEETWSQLQERLRKSRERRSPSNGLVKSSDNGRDRRRSVPPNPLPRLESPSHPDSLRLTSPELRGSHFQKVPPVTTHRTRSEDTLSLDSFNSDTVPDPQLAPPHSTTTPYYHDGTSQPSPATTHTRVPAWDPYTGRRSGYEVKEQRRRGKRKYYVRQPSADFEGDIRDAMQANQMDYLAQNRDRYLDHGSDGEGPSLREYDNLFGGKELIRVPAQRHRDPSFSECMQDELFGRTFLEYFLTSCLQDDLVLEVALDVMVGVREEREIERQLSRPVLDVGEEILNEVVHETLTEVSYLEIRGTVKGYWTSMLDSPSIYKPVARDLLREVIDEEVTSLVPECISDLVSEYFVQKDVVADYNVICDEVMRKLLPDIVVEAVYDESIQSTVQWLIHDEIVSLAGSFLEETFATGRPKIPFSLEERQHDEGKMVNLADDFLLDVAIFESLLSMRLLPNQQVWNPEEYLDLFMDSMILDQVLGQQLEVVKRRDGTEACLPLKRFHEKICTNVAIDVVMDELTGHLDEDMTDLDEYEMEIDGPNYEPP